MSRIITSFSDDLVATLQAGGVAIVRTDTLYGIVACASNRTAVERVYAAKKRTPTKSPIILIADTSSLYDTAPTPAETTLKELWPGPYSLILPSIHAPDWIRRGNESIAYRVPAHDTLRKLLTQTSPLIAPSANPEDKPPALTVQQAVDYFGDQVDLYVDGGEVTDTRPSTLLRFSGDKFEKLR